MKSREARSPFSRHVLCLNFCYIPARQNGDFGRSFGYFPLIFNRFSADGTPSAVLPPTCLQISPISAYFCLKWYPILVYKLKHGAPSAFFLWTCLRILPIFCLCSTHFLPIFQLTFLSFSSSPVLPGCTSLNLISILTRVHFGFLFFSSLETTSANFNSFQAVPDVPRRPHLLWGARQDFRRHDLHPLPQLPRAGGREAHRAHQERDAGASVG